MDLRQLLLPLLFVSLTVHFDFTRCYITGILPRLPLSGKRAPPGTPWPMPSNWTSTPVTLTIDPRHFEMTSSISHCDVIDYNLKRYRDIVFSEADRSKGHRHMRAVKVDITSGHCDKYPTFESDEEYVIEVSGERRTATITSNTTWGALRGLETFSQLIWQVANGSYVINETTVRDSPRFAHRGILLDTARHFLPMSIIKSNLDAMQWNKFNVFHWHMTDDQSFPFQSVTYPNLTTLGTYNSESVYTKDDVADIVEYARLRGIRVIPEIDSPAHTRAIGNAFPHLLTSCYGKEGEPHTANFPQHSEMEVLMVSREQVYDFMKNLLGDVRQLFKDDFIHVGLDEVNDSCWRSNPDINTFMKEQNLDNYTHLEEHYANRLINITRELGFKSIAYQEPVINGARLSTNDTLVQVWRDTNKFDVGAAPWRDYAAKVAHKGYRMIISACWYLNYIQFPVVWKDYYKCDPQDFEGTEEEKALVVGGEAAMWTEFADETNILQTIWPSASAVAERLWSPKGQFDLDDVRYRLDDMRCTMIRRGIPAQPILPGHCSARTKVKSTSCRP